MKYKLMKYESNKLGRHLFMVLVLWSLLNFGSIFSVHVKSKQSKMKQTRLTKREEFNEAASEILQSSHTAEIDDNSQVIPLDSNTLKLSQNKTKGNEVIYSNPKAEVFYFPMQGGNKPYHSSNKSKNKKLDVMIEYDDNVHYLKPTKYISNTNNHLTLQKEYNHNNLIDALFPNATKHDEEEINQLNETQQIPYEKEIETNSDDFLNLSDYSSENLSAALFSLIYSDYEKLKGTRTYIKPIFNNYKKMEQSASYDIPNLIYFLNNLISKYRQEVQALQSEHTFLEIDTQAKNNLKLYELSKRLVKDFIEELGKMEFNLNKHYLEVNGQEKDQKGFSDFLTILSFFTQIEVKHSINSDEIILDSVSKLTKEFENRVELEQNKSIFGEEADLVRVMGKKKIYKHNEDWINRVSSIFSKLVTFLFNTIENSI